MNPIKRINTKPNTQYTFDNYFTRQREITGLRKVINGSYKNPVVVSGPSGSGVTHLLNALGNETIAQQKKAIYLTSEWLMFLFYKSASDFAIGELKYEIAKFDVIAIDNIQFIYRKSQKLKTFLVQLINLAVKWNKQIVLGCSRANSDFTKSKVVSTQIVFERLKLKEPASESIYRILKNLCSAEDKIPDKLIYEISCYNGHIQQHINCLIAIRFKSRAGKMKLDKLSVEQIEDAFNIKSYFPKQQLRRGYMQTQLLFARESRVYKYLSGKSRSKQISVSGQ